MPNPYFFNQLGGSSSGKWDWVIVDLDGTLSDYTHRKHFLKGHPTPEVCASTSAPDWESFNREAKNDKVKPDIKHIVQMAAHSGHAIAVVTGRSGKFADTTIAWLRNNKIPCDLLLMRSPGDYRSDNTVKRELYQHWIEGRGKVHFVLEDRDSVVEMWRSLSLTCLQVMKGEY